jgi:D-alanyl-D-alanine dipeptidase
MFWDGTPVADHLYVANPALGSKHNRGCAVDLTVYDLRTGQPLDMPSGYDEMSERAHSDYAGGTAQQNANRALLRKTMEAEGFEVNPEEWWHFDYKDWRLYPIMNVPFEELGPTAIH